MAPLPGTTARALVGPTTACDGINGRLGWLSRAQTCWRGSAWPLQCVGQRAERRRKQRGHLQARAALLDPPPFDPSKLEVEYLPGGRDATLMAGPRRYTLTHNDVTGSLQLSIGREYNRRQLDSWYTRIVRDEILAEWRDTAPPSATAGGGDGARGGPRPSLHVYCHVSGEELWPAPPQLRSFIFQREMALVLDTIAHAEGEPGGLLRGAPHLRTAPVYVHLSSDIPQLDRVVEWGVLGDRSTWRTAQSSVMRSLLSSVLGTLDDADATDGSNGSWSRTSFSSASGSWDDAAAPGALAAGTIPESSAGPSGSGSDVEQQQQQAVAAVVQQQQQQQLTSVEASSVQQLDMSLAAESQASGAAGVCADSSSSSSSNGAGSSAASLRVPLGSGGAVGAANGAVSLATAQQAAERTAGAWLGMPPGEPAPQRVPAVEVVVSRQR